MHQYLRTKDFVHTIDPVDNNWRITRKQSRGWTRKRSVVLSWFDNLTNDDNRFRIYHDSWLISFAASSTFVVVPFWILKAEDDRNILCSLRTHLQR